MIIPNGYAQANFVYEGDAVPDGAENTLGLALAPGPASPMALAIALVTIWESRVIPNLTSVIGLERVDVKYGPNSTGAAASAPGSNTGTFGELALPSNTSLLLHKVTAMGGRQGRGRLYLPGFREDHVSPAGIVTAADVDDLTDTFNGVNDDLAAINCVPVLLRSAGAPVSTPEPITSWICDGKVATQRRRLRR